MTPAPTAGEYRDQLRRLLDQGRDTLTVEEQQTLRTVVRARRNRRRGSETIQTSTAIDAHAITIVELLESAARVLRPRETKELDDFATGVERVAPDHDPYIPVRLHRRGG
jgi:hypothetical protein